MHQRFDTQPELVGLGVAPERHREDAEAIKTTNHDPSYLKEVEKWRIGMDTERCWSLKA